MLRANISYGQPCACGGGEATNPPEDVDFAGIDALFDSLSRSVAVGELTERLGLPGGRELVDRVVRFVESSPAVLGAAPETGGILGVAERAAPKAARALGIVEEGAEKLLRGLRKVPTSLVVVGIGGLLASSWLSSQEKVELAALAEDTQRKADVLASLPPEARAKAVADFGGLSTGWGLGQWLGVGALVLGGLWAWRSGLFSARR